MAADVFLPVGHSLGFPTVNRGPARPGGKDVLALCSHLFPQRFTPRDSLVAITLSNVNPQNHLAIANEARYKIMYNISLAALSEAKGTLLADRNIVVAEGPKPVRPVQIAREPRFAIGITPSPFAAPYIETDTGLALAKPQLTTQAKLDDQTKKASIAQAQNAEAPAKPKTWSFSISIGWDKPLQIKGTISVDEPAHSR